jgi:threonine/homoserine/homoserine lactone efflux protein
MSLDLWLLYVATDTLMCFSPGPAVLFIIAQGLRYGGRHCLWANGGILAANTFYFGLSATGLGAVLAASTTLFTVIKWIGAAFLIWLGIRSFLGHAGIQKARAAQGAPVSGPKLFAQAFALQATNPKALLFFAALLPQFLDVTRPLLPQVLIVGITGNTIELMVLGFYGYGAGRLSQALLRPNVATWVDRGAGSFLMAAGVLTAIRS